jgi:hypothetical protein
MTTRTLSVLRTHDDREIPVAGEYAIDPAHTSVEFIGRHLMITKVRGRIPEVSGTITIDDQPEDPTSRSSSRSPASTPATPTGTAISEAPTSSTPTRTRPSSSAPPTSSPAPRAPGR